MPEVKKCTKAGTGCGSCVKVLGQLVNAELEANGVEVDKGLCGCFAQTRAGAVRDRARPARSTSYQELLDPHGREDARGGDGCEVCKPTVGLDHRLPRARRSARAATSWTGEQAALQDTNDHFLANLQKNGSYSVVPRIPGGEITPEKLIVIGEVARDFGLYTKITGGQRIDMFGARVDQLPLIWARLVDAGFESGHAYGKSLRTVKSCVGQTWCRYGVQDSRPDGHRPGAALPGPALPAQAEVGGLRAAPASAPRRSRKDFGVIATSNGWNLYVGGNGGATPRHADLLAQDLSDAELIRLIDRFLMFYIRTADRLERTSTWLERIEGGLDHVRDVVVHDSLGICEELESLMADHVAHYRDEWSETINDPEKLRPLRLLRQRAGRPRPDRAVRRPSATRSSPTCRCCPSARASPGRNRRPMTIAPDDHDDPDDRQLEVQLRLGEELVRGLRAVRCSPPAAVSRPCCPTAARPRSSWTARARRTPSTTATPSPAPQVLSRGLLGSRRRPPLRRLAAAQAALRPGDGALPGRPGCQRSGLHLPDALSGLTVRADPDSTARRR